MTDDAPVPPIPAAPQGATPASPYAPATPFTPPGPVVSPTAPAAAPVAAPGTPVAAPPAPPSGAPLSGAAPLSGGAPVSSGAPVSTGPAWIAPAPPRSAARTGDVVATIILLALGLFGLLFGLLMAALLPETLSGNGGFVDDRLVAGDQAVIAISHLVLYAAAVGGSIPLMLKKKIAFWVPLAAGIVAAIIFWATIMGAMVAAGAV